MVHRWISWGDRRPERFVWLWSLIARQLDGDLLGEIARIVAGLPANMQDGQTYSSQDIIDEGIARAAIGAAGRSRHSRRSSWRAADTIDSYL
jgi:hypothetical protein